MDKNNKNEYQRIQRSLNNNAYTKKYEKTHKGFLMRLYRNMKSRITGIQNTKFHLYQNKELFDKEDFYLWSLNNHKFIQLFEDYKNNNYNRKLAPSIDRIDSNKGYSFDNVEWVTMSENSRRGTYSKCIKYNQNIKLK